MKKIIILVILLFFSCKKTDEVKAQNYLEVYYMGPGINTPFDYSCGMISKQFLEGEINYKKISQGEIVEPFMKMFDNYKISGNTTGINIRIKVFVHHNNSTDTLCLGEHFNTYKNSVKMIDKPELLTYLKKVIAYDNTVSSFVRKHPERFKTSK